MKTILLLLALVGTCQATEVHLQNFTGAQVLFSDGVVELRCPVGVSVFEWVDSATVTVGSAGLGTNVTCVLTDAGITQIDVGVDVATMQPVAVVSGRQGWLAFYTEGFGFGLVVFGWGFILRIYKNIGKFNPEM